MDGWIRVCTTAELLPGESTVAWDGDTPILVVNLDGELHALEDRCTHEDYELSTGPVDVAEGSIECLLHAARFDIRRGKCLEGPINEDVATYRVKVEGGDVWVMVPA